MATNSTCFDNEELNFEDLDFGEDIEVLVDIVIMSDEEDIVLADFDVDVDDLDEDVTLQTPTVVFVGDDDALKVSSSSIKSSIKNNLFTQVNMKIYFILSKFVSYV